MVKARLIITFDCTRNCSFCVNKNQGILFQARRIELDKIDMLQKYGQVLITGGEPILHLGLLSKVIKALKGKTKLYLYASIPELSAVLVDHFDGITYTIHKDSLPGEVEEIQSIALIYPEKTFRLNIDPNYDYALKIKPYLWDKIKIKTWHNPARVRIPENETLYILEK